jgi:hypothetical protein
MKTPCSAPDASIESLARPVTIDLAPAISKVSTPAPASLDACSYTSELPPSGL